MISTSLHAPALAVRDLVPTHLALTPSRVRVTPAAEPDHARLPSRAIATRALDVADLVPAKFVLPKPSIAIAMVPARMASAKPIAQDNVEKIIAPTPVHIERPVYPQNALARDVEGRVIVAFVLNADGSVGSPKVVSAQPAGVFDGAAVQALRDWRFAVTKGAVGKHFRQTFSFTLHPDDNAVAGSAEVQAREACYTPTGTHICRRDAEPAQTFDAVSAH